MRFLLFNLVVVGALFYLFTADRNDINAVAGKAHATVAQVEEITATAVDTVSSIVAAEQDRPAQVVSKPIPPVEAPAAKPPAPVEEPAPAQDPEDTVVEEAVDDDGNSGKKEEESTSPTLVASHELPVVEVPVRLVHTAPHPGSAEARVPVTDPAVARRRAEVLGELAPTNGGSAEPGAPTTQSKPAKPAITVAEGEQLMSPRERRRELFALAQEMELLFLQKAVE